MAQNRKKNLLVLWAVSLYFVCFAGEEKPLYRRPLNIDNGYSSSFQEFRGNHFHAGLDFRTFQKTGYPVHAVSDGEIYKIRVVKRGSGRGLYLKHTDGYTSIYFHLEKFAPQLEEIVRRVRKAKGKKYFGNYFLKKPIAFNKGEVIAYSGETGAGFPHLHLEIRDPQYFAVNPFPLLELPKKDTARPRLEGILLRNRGDSLINGGVGEVYLKFHRDRGNHYRTKEPLLVNGGFDMVLETYDLSDSGRRVAPRQVSVFIDDINYFHLEFDRFQRDDNNQLGFVYDLWRSRSSWFFFNLFFQEGYELEDEKIRLGDVLDQVGVGKHLVRIEVEDYMGNRSVGLLPFYKIARPVLKLAKIDRTEERFALDMAELRAEAADEIKIKIFDRRHKSIYAGFLSHRRITERLPFLLKGISGDLSHMDFNFIKQDRVYFNQRYLLDDSHLEYTADLPLEIFINHDDIYVQVKESRISAQNLHLRVIQGDEAREVKPSFSGDGVFFHFKPMNLHNRLLLNFTVLRRGKLMAEIQDKLQIVHLREGIEQEFKRGDFSVSFAPRSVYEPKVLLVEEKNYKSRYPVLSSQVSLSPYHFPFLDTVYYKFKKNVANPRQAGIFKYDPGRKRWRYVYTTYQAADHTFKTRLISSGTFALMRDIFAPEIYFTRPGTRYLDKVRRLTVKILDTGKGVNDGTLHITLNGRPLDCEYDYDRAHVKIEDVSALKKGSNRLRIKVKDYAGNSSSKTYHFSLK